MKHPDTLIPENTRGAKTDTASSIKLSSREEAAEHFKICKKRLLTVSEWHTLAGPASAKFQLTNSQGTPLNRQTQQGDYFKINIPAPGSETGDGYDWVQVEAIDEANDTNEDWEYILIKVRPASNPQSVEDNTAHFFNDNANSYFLVKRNKYTVSAEVHGRNEEANTETNTISDKVRNLVVAIGAMLGISNVQWKSLTDGIVSKQI